MNKKQTLEKIKKLVDRYEKLSEADKKRINEAQTINKFIRPLFEALGWNFEHDVYPETDVSGKRVDFAFRLNNVTKFFVEAKKISANLDREDFAKQAINYSYHKSVPYAILTDFEAIKIYTTEWDKPDIQSCQWIEIKYKDFLNDKKLFWLSKENIERGILDAEADKAGRRPKTTIDKRLAKDLVKWRDILKKGLEAYNPKVDKKKIAKCVQTILNRLIFMRTLEDRGIEEQNLRALVREWQDKKGIKSNELLFAINKLFKKFSSYYNSGLFDDPSAADFLGDKLEADDGDFVEVINELYKTKSGFRYNFADIPSDIFGSIYEQYLGHIQQEHEVDKKKSKRKSQGIYYTPRYIVDYIVQNTLGEVLKNKNAEEIKNLKILDPACGSGSFLISAYSNLIEYWQKYKFNQHHFSKGQLAKLEKEFKNKGKFDLSPPQKQRILLNNIYGVDLDREAAELARLNLLLKMVGRRAKLPNIDQNIAVGNSLIDDPKISDKAFNWQKSFPEVFRQGGFDVLIGNPPYVSVKSGINKILNKYYTKNFFVAKGQYDLFLLFIEQSFNLLKDGGHFGFIIPKQILTNINFKPCREFILKNSSDVEIIDTKMPFLGAQVEAIILICEKYKDFNENYILKFGEIDENGKVEITGGCALNIIKTNNPNLLINIKQNILTKRLQIRFDKKSIKLKDIFSIIRGLEFGKKDKRIFKKKTDGSIAILRGEDLKCYSVGNKFFVNKKDINKNILIKDKILVRRVSSDLVAGLDEDGFCSLNTIYNLILKNKNYSTKYILAILNSKLMNYLFGSLNPVEDKLFPYIRIYQLEQIPIYKINFSDKKEKAKHDELASLADKMLKLNKSLQKLDPILDDEEYNKIKKQIDKTDKEIDKKVYKLYGLGEEEIKVIENN